MEPVDTIQISPDVRVQLYPDHDCGNPLREWDHGIQFIALPDPSRTWRDYHEPTSNTYGGVDPLDFLPWGEYREFNTWEPGYDYDSPHPAHMSPSLIAFLDRECAAWGVIDRNGYDGTLSLNVQETRDYTHRDGNTYQYRSVQRDDLEKSDAIALVSRAMFRAWHGIPDDKPMPRGYRQQAAKSLRAVLDEYNKWATGDVYGYQVQRHSPTCLECMDPDDDTPQDDCNGWQDTEDGSCWGLIGYEYAEEEATHAGMLEAGIPIPQVVHDINNPARKGIQFDRMEGVGNEESPANRTVFGYDKTGHLTVLTGGKYLKGSKYAYDKYPAVRMRPEYIHGTDRVAVWFERDDQETNDRIILHRLSWESAQRTMRHLAQR